MAENIGTGEYGSNQPWSTSWETGVCPGIDGWHVPSQSEFSTLISYLGGSAGGKLKEQGSSHWNYYSDEITDAVTNSSGFTALPAGFYSPDYSNGTLSETMGKVCIFWTSSSVSGNPNYAYIVQLYYSTNDASERDMNKQSTGSVRCLADEITTGCTDPNASNYDETANVDDGSCEYAVNDAPVIDAISDPSAILEDAGAQTINLAGIGDGDADVVQAITSVTATSNNTSLIPNPTVTYTPSAATGSLAYTPVSNANGSAVITVTVVDDGGTANSGVNTTTTTFTVAVTAVNDEPVANAQGVTVLEDIKTSITLTGSDGDADATQSLTYILTGLPGTGSLSETSGGSAIASGVLPLTLSDAELFFTTASNDVSQQTFTFKVQDSGGTANSGDNESSNATVTVTITPVNMDTGCTDPEACNYDETANVDDGSCEYDILLYQDSDGDGLGSNNSLWQCEGYDGWVTNNDDIDDDCFSNVHDECGVCDGNGIPEGWCDCAGDIQHDCAGECGGDAVNDNCGVCDNDATNDCVQDECFEWGGEGVLDDCGVCDANPDNDCTLGCTDPEACNYDEEVNVDDGSCEFTSCDGVLNVPSEYSTIQSAIDAASDGDEVLVSAGTYFENINFNDKNIAVIGEDRETTIIDGGQLGMVVKRLGDNGLIKEFSIQNGLAYSDESCGGGYGWNGKGVGICTGGGKIQNCNIRNNTSASGSGGGIFAYGTVTIENCDLYNNFVGSSGAGIMINNDGSTALISNCKIYDNFAGEKGGGIEVRGTVTIENSVIFNNSGGGVNCLQIQPTNVTITNTTIVGNSGGSHMDYFGVQASSYSIGVELTILNSIIYGNESDNVGSWSGGGGGGGVDVINVSYSDIQGGYAGEGNLDVNPLFCDVYNDDFTVSEGSPVLGTGQDGADMGAFGVGCEPPEIYGCTGESSCNYNPYATVDDGSCIYPEENYDCYGICIVEVDCAGECGGLAVVDVCGVCGGDNATCTTVIDIDGNIYETVQIGDQIWIRSNLKVTHYNNGDEIQFPDPNCSTCFRSYTDGQYGVYDNEPSNADIYGNQYNWAAINDDRGICPIDFHVPSNDEWKALVGFLDENADLDHWLGQISLTAGNKLKSTGTLEDGDGLWAYSPEEMEVSNESGFTGNPGGNRNYLYNSDHNMSFYGHFWSYTESYDTTYCEIEDLCKAYNVQLRYQNARVDLLPNDKRFGFSTRCLADVITTGCTNPEACNYDATATDDDGSCEYAQVNYDCDGNCTTDIDCAGECSGTAIEDECGVCGGDGSSCTGCSYPSACNYDSNVTIDDGSCVFPEQFYDCSGNCIAVADCAGICGGNAIEDQCGVCNDDPNDDCTLDCAGIWGGSAWLSDCGCVAEGNSGDDCDDCAGIPNGSNVEDQCGICDNNPTNNCIQDCAGTWGGTAVVDECSICNGDGTGCSSQAGVSLEIKNVSIASDNSGTLDIYMTNQPGCSYCLEPTYNNNAQDWFGKKEDCEKPPPYGNSTWISYAPITEAECAAIPSINGNGGWWFNGMVGGAQFELTGINITGASGGSAETAFTSGGILVKGTDVPSGISKIIIFSLSDATIPIGDDILLLHVTFTDFDNNSICFGEDTGSDGDNAISGQPGSDDVAVYVGANWGNCYCASGTDFGCGCGQAAPSSCDNICGSTSIADCAGVCGGSAVADCADVCGGSGVVNTDGDGACCASGVIDCDNVCDGSAVLSGCDNACNSTAVADCAGTCNGTAVADCTGECGGSSVVDNCGVCDGGNILYDDCQDLTNLDGSSWWESDPIYNCEAYVEGGWCDSPGNVEWPNDAGYSADGACCGCGGGIMGMGADIGCDGVCFSDVELDCTGLCGGDHVVDECGVCGGAGAVFGDTGCCEIEMDECNVCGGNNTSTDVCGICNGPGPIYECGCHLDTPLINYTSISDTYGWYNPNYTAWDPVFGSDSLTVNSFYDMPWGVLTSRSYDAYWGPNYDSQSMGYNTMKYLINDVKVVWDGVYGDPDASGFVPVVSGGSQVWIYKASFGDLANHPSPENPGTGEPFLITVPFKVFDLEAGDEPVQISIIIWDRKQAVSAGYDGSYDGDGDGTPAYYAFNPYDRMYTEFINRPYEETLADFASNEAYLTWNLVWWEAPPIGDEVTISYANHCDCTGNLRDECGVCGGNNTACTDWNDFDSTYVIPDEFQFTHSTLQAYYFFSSVTIDSLLLDPNDWVGAFNGDVCVGAKKWNTSLCGGGVCDVPVMGYSENEEWSYGYMQEGDIPTFKIYDASDSLYYNATPSIEVPWANMGFSYIVSLTANTAIYGCTDESAINYNEEAAEDDGSCYYDAPPDEFLFNQSNQQAFYFFNNIYDPDGNTIDPNDWVAAFNGNVCVGSKQWNSSLCTNGICEIMVMGDEYSEFTEGYMLPGDIPTFKVYDVSEDQIYYAIPSEDIPWNNLALNYIDNLQSYSGFDIEIPLHTGSNLVSFYVLPENTSISNVMGDIAGSITGVISEGIAATYIDTGWVGSLTNLNTYSGYWLSMLNEDTLNLSGSNLDPSKIYDLHEGSNLISFPIPGSIEIWDALPSDVAGNISGIITEGVAALHINYEFWVGSLQLFEGLKGYWVITDIPVSFSFNVAGISRQSKQPYIEYKPAGFDYHQSSSQAFYFVQNVSLEDGEIQIGDWLLSYCGNRLSGIRQWHGEYMDIPVMGFDGSDETSGYCSPGDIPNIKHLDQNGEVTKLIGEIPTWDNLGMYMINNLTAPPVVIAEYSINQLYPNPFNAATTINFAIPVESEVMISIFDLTGKEIINLVNQNMNAGYHSIVWHANYQSSGIYFVQMQAGASLTNKKLMLIK